MPRELKTAEEIQAAVQQRIDQQLQDGGDEDFVTANVPIRLARPDSRGCNWVIEGFSGDRSYFKMVGIAVLEAKDRFNLA
ncbi:hypothetical protein [Variovorax saccharolyticus]|uniref:hypothetical protein n=1 Tax=Variovorax saccharolyticus TaxID=3053516 RepID=UPI0025762EE1|nr:hypothetical protein [Variovorax sp. J31P216]MDM0029648.1 hypothetical protein [Variovorax sp. J31P216]